MFVARDTEGTLVWADEANKQTDYFCPVCSGKLILRAGEVNAHHFAHEAGACPDHWHYDMSDWHKTMQEQFPIECREVVMKHNGEIHRADVFKDGIVVEFQHSPITPQEFRERNTFYNTLGYKVAWVFDVSDKGIVPTIGKDELPDYFHLYWERPLSVLRVVDRHRGFLAPCPKGNANGGMRTYGCRDCESFICSMTCVSGGSSGVYCAYPAQANTYGDWDTNFRV